MFLRKPFAGFVFCLLMGVLLIAPQQSMAQPFMGAGDILILRDHDTNNNGGTFHIWPGVWAWPNHDGVTTRTYDQSLHDLMTTWFPNATTTETNCGPTLDERGLRTIQTVNTAAKVAWLNGYDILLISNSVGSGDLAANAAASAVWDTSITQPMLCMKPFLTGTNSNRWSWYVAGNPGENAGTTPTTHLTPLIPGDPIFSGIDISSGSLRVYSDGPYSSPSNLWWNSGSTSTTLNSVGQRLPNPAMNVAGTMTNNYGRHIARFTGYNTQLGIAAWDTPTTGSLFYPGGARRRGGARVLFSLNDDRNMVPRTEVGTSQRIARDMIPNLTPQGRRLIANIIVNLVPSLPASMSEFKVE